MKNMETLWRSQGRPAGTVRSDVYELQLLLRQGLVSVPLGCSLGSTGFATGSLQRVAS